VAEQHLPPELHVHHVPESGVHTPDRFDDVQTVVGRGLVDDGIGEELVPVLRIQLIEAAFAFRITVGDVPAEHQQFRVR
jgi:hypothetical protein